MITIDNTLKDASSPGSILNHLINLQRTDERSVPLAVRVHRTLELADDKSYVITCGKAGFRNARYVYVYAK